MTIAFVAAGDLHLDDFIWRRHRQITGDAVAAFRSVVDHAIRLKVPLVLLGDLFDCTEPAPHLVRLVRQEFDRAAAAGVAVYAIQGNHDKRPVPWYLACSPYPIHVGDGHEETIGGLRCCGYDYAVKDSIEQQLAAMRARPDMTVQVLFLHQAVRQALKFDGAWNCDLDWVDPRIPLVLMGDIHAANEFPTAGGRAHYTGSTHPRSLAELGPKHCLAVHDDLSVEPLELPQRFVAQVVWTELDEVDPEQVVRDVAAAASELPPVCFVRYDASRAAQARVLIDRLHAESAICIDDPLVAGRTTLDTSTVDTSDLPGVPTLLGRLIDPVADRFAFQLGVDLMDPTADTQQLIRDQRDRFMAARKQAGQPA